MTDTTYPLYHTLNKNLKKGDLTAKQKKKLIDDLSSIENDQRLKKAIIMLIAEHARVTENQKFDSDISEKTLPFDIKQRTKDVHCDLDKFPVELKWILWKFMNLKSLALTGPF
jgi:hypothetical protein